MSSIRFTQGIPYFIDATGTAYRLGYWLTASATWDPPSLNAGAATTTTVAVTGAAMGDLVHPPSFSNSLQGMVLSGYVSVAGTVTVVLVNTTVGTVDLASGTLRVAVGKFVP